LPEVPKNDGLPFPANSRACHLSCPAISSKKILALDSLCPTASGKLLGMKNIRHISPKDLLRIGLDPKIFPPEKLFYWLVRPRNPVVATDDPLANMFIEGMLKGEPIEFIYVGGSKPGSPRRVSVSLVFQHESEGRIYVAAYCHERRANRVFALDLIMTIYPWS
jgi:hypothetical protein